MTKQRKRAKQRSANHRPSANNNVSNANVQEEHESHYETKESYDGLTYQDKVDDYVENPLEEQKQPQSAPKSASPQAPTAPTSVTKAENIGAAAKIEQAQKSEADQRKKAFDQAEKRYKQAEKELKYTEELRKTIKELSDKLAGENKAESGADKPNDPLAAQPIEKKKGIFSTIKGAVGQNVKTRIGEPLKTVTTAKGLTGLVAARYAGNPNSLIGGIAGALHERELVKQDEREKKENFHTGFITGTDAGKKMAAAISDDAARDVKAQNPKLSGKKLAKEIQKEADKRIREKTDEMYNIKADQEKQIAELNQKEKVLQGKDKLFGLSTAEKEERDRLIKERERLVSGSDLGKKQTVTPKKPDDNDPDRQKFEAKLQKKISELENYHDRSLTDDEKDRIYEWMKGQAEKDMEKASEQIELLKSIDNTLKGDTSSSNKMAQANAEAAQDTESKIPTPNASPAAQNGPKKGFLDKAKGVLGKSKEMLSKGSESILSKLVESPIGKIGGTIASALAPVAPMAGAVAAGLGGGALVGHGFNKSWEALTGNSFGNSIANVFKSDAEKQLDAENAKFEAAQAERVKVAAAKPVAPIPQPVMEKVARDVKPEIDEKSAEVEKAKAEKPVVVSQPTVAPIINNTSNTTTVVRTPIRNQEPSFNRTLQKNFL